MINVDIKYLYPMVSLALPNYPTMDLDSKPAPQIVADKITPAETPTKSKRAKKLKKKRGW